MVRITVAISGASGANLGLKLVKLIPKDIEVNVILSDNSKVVLEKENHINIHKNSTISANVASGSYKTDAMIVVPCSTNTLSKIACGISDNLISRAASVMLKERRKLILAVREMPYSTIILENMAKLSSNGVIIAPPVMGYYSEQSSLDDMENFVIGKWFDLLGIEHDLFKRWEG
ncbi:MAG: UbiX family decarboxylase associated with menaquinone via futalosine [uncultured Campylobacterales bacterium]|uniref:Flavin prenyltransferase UbiX n=1 Tax=uncultured Campylobacterales bacterium TaxID=352960 RepID=A0A6S6SZC5_9BACT|nr:MAG: UbiX family decarboxylase associated with menaquinone via futalosine [uncultured Campylobacterales bacterium]